MSEKEPRPSMFEGGNNPENVPHLYIDLLEEIQKDPHSDEVWQNAISLAKEEEVQGGGSENYYTHISLAELIVTGKRLKAARLREKDWRPDAEARQRQYSVLAKKSSTGEYWYDIILGHVNDKMFAPVKARLERLVELRAEKGRFKTGLDLGSGLGNTLRTVAPYFEKVIGVERLPQLVKLTKNEPSMPQNVEIVCANALDLKFSDESFDVVVSNGLTHYLPLRQVENYAHEVNKVLKDGGRYLEAYVVKKDNDRLPIIENEYLTSAKALLVCLIDAIVSKVDNKYPYLGYIEPWDFSEMINAFSRNGLALRRGIDSDRENDISIEGCGVGVFEFIKDKKHQEEMKRGYSYHED